MIPVAFDLRDPVRSGIARVARSLARAFIERAADRFSITLAGPVDTLTAIGVQRWSDRPIRIVDWPAGRYTLRAERLWGKVRREVGDAAWYFPHWDVPWHSPPDRYVMTVHDLGHLRIPGASAGRRLLTRAWLGRAARRAGAIAAISDFTRRELVHEWPELSGRIELVPNAVDPVFFEPAPALPASVTEFTRGAAFMLSVGIRKRHKNLRYGVDVLAHVPELTWVIVGEWFPEWEEVERAARAAGVRQRMLVIDSVDDDRLRALYAHSALLFFPSSHEGFGLPLLEALASGTRVVAANATAVPEVVGQFAVLCELSSHAFVEGVRRALHDRAWPREEAREHARGYSWTVGADRLARLLERVA